MGQWTTGIERDIQADSEAFDASVSEEADTAGWVCSDCGHTECECASLSSPENEEWDRTAQQRAEWDAEAFMSQYDDDPNPYHGDYSEM